MLDDLSEEIENLKKRQKTHEYKTKRSHDESRIGRMQEDVTKFHRFLYQFGIAFSWVYQNILVHVGRWIGKPFRLLFNVYRHLWALCVYRKNKYGSLVFSKTRAGVFLTSTVVFLYFSSVLALFAYDTTLYFATVKHNDIVYLTMSQEIVPGENIHSVQGCDSLPCNDQDSIYYRITPSLFNHVWALIHDQNIFYPDFVAAAVPPGVAKCFITSYGIRLKLFVRNLDVYPELLKASCQPI